MRWTRAPRTQTPALSPQCAVFSWRPTAASRRAPPEDRPTPPTMAASPVRRGSFRMRIPAAARPVSQGPTPPSREARPARPVRRAFPASRAARAVPFASLGSTHLCPGPWSAGPVLRAPCPPCLRAPTARGAPRIGSLLRAAWPPATAAATCPWGTTRRLGPAPAATAQMGS